MVLGNDKNFNVECPSTIGLDCFYVYDEDEEETIVHCGLDEWNKIKTPLGIAKEPFTRINVSEIFYDFIPDVYYKGDLTKPVFVEGFTFTSRSLPNNYDKQKFKTYNDALSSEACEILQKIKKSKIK